MNQIFFCYSTHTVLINEPDAHLLQYSHCLDHLTIYSPATVLTRSGSMNQILVCYCIYTMWSINQILICYCVHTIWINEPDTHLLQYSHVMDQWNRFWINEPDTHLLHYSHCLPPTKSDMTEIVDSWWSSRLVSSSRVKLRLPKNSALHSSSTFFSSAIFSCCSSFTWDRFSCRHRPNGTKHAAANIHYLTERTGILTEKDKWKKVRQ